MVILVVNGKVGTHHQSVAHLNASPQVVVGYLKTKIHVISHVGLFLSLGSSATKHRCQTSENESKNKLYIVYKGGSYGTKYYYSD